MAGDARLERGRRRRFLSVPVLSVLALIALIYYSTVFVFLDELLGLRSLNGRRNALAFTFLAFMCLASFAAAVLTDPGSVPQSFGPEIEDPQRNGTQLKYCDKCSTYKPSRAHHCRACRRCVLKMDHHCLWINNCVGYQNYKPFIVFVLYACIASIYSTVIFVSDILQDDGSSIKSSPVVLFYVFCGAIVIFLSLILGSLLGWHIYLISHNMTTIEYRGAVRAQWLAKKSGQKYHHPFDLGFYRNISSVLGPNILKWFWPLAVGHLKDGMQFPVYNN